MIFLLLIWQYDNINFAVPWKIFPTFSATEHIYLRNCNTCKNQWNCLILLACVQSVQYYSDKRNHDIGRSKLAPWNTVVREKIRVPQIIEKLPEFYGIRNVTTVFSSVAKCNLPGARLTQVTPFQSIFLIPTLILFLHLHESQKSSLFPNIHFYFLMCAICLATLLLLYLINKSQSARNKSLNSSVAYVYSFIFFFLLCLISFSGTLLSMTFRLLWSSLSIWDQTSYLYKTVSRISHIFCLVYSTEICASNN